MSSTTSGLQPVIVATNASANFGGEAILPLHYFAQLHDLGVKAFLITHARNQPELEVSVRSLKDYIRFIPESHIDATLWFMGNLIGHRLTEYSLGPILQLHGQARLKKLVKDMVANHGCNVVHQPYPVSPKMPSLFYDLGVPVVIGPMNGGMEFPKSMDLEKPLVSAMKCFSRRLSGLANTVFSGKRAAQVLLVANERTRRSLPSNVASRYARVFVENGVDLSRFHREEPLPVARPPEIKIAFVGRLVAWKNVECLLRASVAVAGGRCSLHIFGDGPAKDGLIELAKQLNISEYVTFYGFVDQQSCAKQLETCHALVLPSLHECGGAVVLEAMALGLIVVASNWGGPADYIDEETGLLIGVDNGPKQFLADLTAALERIDRWDPELVQRGETARQTVRRSYCWSQKAQAMVGIYQEAISSNTTPT